MEEGCFDIEFPIPLNRALWTSGQRWFHEHHGKYESDSFMAPFQDWVVSGEVWLFTEKGVVEHCHGAALRFGNHGGVMLGSLCLVASLQHLKDEYDDWDKNPFEHSMACAESQTIQGQTRGLTCVFRVYPFQLQRLKRLLKLNLVTNLIELVGAHVRFCFIEK